jgi:hypothetical protein
MAISGCTLTLLPVRPIFTSTVALASVSAVSFRSSLLVSFSGANHSTRTVTVLSAQGRMVRGPGPDGLRSGAGLGFPA